MFLLYSLLALVMIETSGNFAGTQATAAAHLWVAHPPQEMNFTVEGKINRLEKNKLTVNSEENMLFHVRYDDKTEIKRQDGGAASAKDLRVGLKVRVDGDLKESGEIVAHRIVIQSAEPPKKSPQSRNANCWPQVCPTCVLA